MSTTAEPLAEIRWKPLRLIPCQLGYRRAKTRFTVVSAGRRSGKTDISKRRAINIAINASSTERARVVFAAPTRIQAKEIYWEDVKSMTPAVYMAEEPRETDLSIQLINGIKLVVMGMDVPKRVEGSPLLHIVLDEYGDMKKEAWINHVRPALADSGGTADFIGKPVGRNHYYHLVKSAQSDTSGQWAHFTWKSAEVLPLHEVESARRDMDELSFRQEFEAEFVSFQGSAYYAYSEEHNCVKGLPYYPDLPLAVCFDFNVSPGVAVIAQEDPLLKCTNVIGEVWIDRNSNTPKVCRMLMERWGNHKGPVRFYGDASGGASGTAKVSGSDWDLIKEHTSAWRDRRFRVPRANPPERSRVNAMNTRLATSDGRHNMRVDPQKAPHVILDLEGVEADDAGDIVKKQGTQLTHISDGLGYYIAYEFPVGGISTVKVQEWF